jgi:hypothetical protein
VLCQRAGKAPGDKDNNSLTCRKVGQGGFIMEQQKQAGYPAMQRSDARVYRLVVMAMLVGLGVVISPILRVEGMCPMAHLINITGSVLLGPWYSFVIATAIGIIRMTAMGIPPLALTGAVFGAALSGICTAHPVAGCGPLSWAKSSERASSAPWLRILS